MANNTSKIKNNIGLGIRFFMEHKKKKKNESNYLAKQRKTLKEMAHHGPEETKNWTDANLIKWYNWKSSQEIAQTTFIREVKAVRSFWRWAYDKRITRKLLGSDLVCPKPPPRRTRVTKKVFEQDVINSSQVLSQRTYAAVVVMYTCGLRATEIEKLKESHIPKSINEKETTFLTVPRTKLRKQRLVPIPNEVTLLALDYLTSRKKKITTSEIFADLDRNNILFTPAQLRSTAIRRWLSAGENIHTVCAWAGHGSIDSTARFIPKPKKLYEPKEKQNAAPV